LIRQGCHQHGSVRQSMLLELHLLLQLLKDRVQPFLLLSQLRGSSHKVLLQ
jgi:hypothetical protein